MLRLTAVEYSNVDDVYEWDEVRGSDGFERQCLFPGTTIEKESTASVRARVRAVLEDSNPDVVAIPGWIDRPALEALAWCLKNGIPAVVMSETTPWDHPRIWWKEAIKRQIVKCFTSGFAGGTPHAEYLASLGIPKSRIFPGYDAVDNRYFEDKAAEIRGQLSEVSEQACSDPEHSSLITRPSSPAGGAPPFFLASARFIEKKNLFNLISAFAAYRGEEKVESGKLKAETKNEEPATKNSRRPWDLVLLGDGPLKARLIAHARSLGLNVVESAPWSEDKAESGKMKAETKSEAVAIGDSSTPGTSPTVFLPGFKQYHELPEYYARAGAFVHASTTEQWGLVVNEAMASGLPVIVSNRCGCATDLVQEGVNGFTFDPADVNQLAGIMQKVFSVQSSVLRGEVRDVSGQSSEVSHQMTGGESEPSRIQNSKSTIQNPQSILPSAMGAASARIISSWGTDRFASGLQQAAEAALAAGPVKPSLVQKLVLRSLLMR